MFNELGKSTENVSCNIQFNPTLFSVGRVVIWVYFIIYLPMNKRDLLFKVIQDENFNVSGKTSYSIQSKSCISHSQTEFLFVYLNKLDRCSKVRLSLVPILFWSPSLVLHSAQIILNRYDIYVVKTGLIYNFFLVKPKIKFQ